MNPPRSRLSLFLKAFGPGILFAATAVGVSHLVQSTRAGALFGFSLVWAVILANLFKYPAFEAGPRYAAATGETLVRGYRRLGRGALLVFVIMTVGTMFTVQAVVTLVCSALLAGVSEASPSVEWWSIIVTSLCVVILVVGRFPLLDKTVKVVIVLLTLATAVTLVAALARGRAHAAPLFPAGAFSGPSLLFLIPLMGWMPSAIDIAVWHSIWTLERRKETGYAPTRRQALLDFNIGYVGTALLALMFLSLGALVMYRPGAEFPDGAKFAGALIGAYKEGIGPWIGPFIFTAAIATMFSTTLTVIDSFPRVWQHVFAEWGRRESGAGERAPLSGLTYFATMVLISEAAIAIIVFRKEMAGGFDGLVDLATALSFLSAPVLAWLNWRVIRSPDVPEEARPRPWLARLHVAGLVFLTGFALFYLVMRFVA